MGSTVFANGMGISHAGSGGKSMSQAPDVCKTLVAIVVVPIPYTNIAESADLADGSATVKIGGNMVAIKGCNYSKSTGDENGSLNGIISGKIQGKAEFTQYSMDVKIEGNNACRNGDMTTQNEGNTTGMNQDSAGQPAEIEVAALEEGPVTLEVELFNKKNEPMAGENYEVYDDNNEMVASGQLDDNGYVFITDLQKVRHHVKFPDVEKTAE